MTRGRRGRGGVVAVLTGSLLLPCCKRDEPQATVQAPATVAAAHSAVTPSNARPEPKAIPAERTLAFSWRPAGASPRAYAMSDALDQHHVLLLRGIEPGKSYPVVVAMHGQPRRGQAPRSYQFQRVVADVARELIHAGELEPFVLVTPVFRFEGQNWPAFDLVAFMAEVNRVLADARVTPQGLYLFGHSGAAGCGGAGLNQAATVAPAAVGFFDTCVGAGFAHAIRALSEKRIPTLVMHSVETAGFVPRQPVEYQADFDFGKVYAPLGMKPFRCPKELPDAPLRPLEYRCARSASGTTLALVVDTGRGEQAHEALVPVAMRYFLRQYIGRGISSTLQ